MRDTLRAALSNAVAEELISRNIATVVRLPAPRKPQRQSWSADEARRFLESARADCDALYTAYVLILFSACGGVRCSGSPGLTRISKAERSIFAGSFSELTMNCATARPRPSHPRPFSRSRTSASRADPAQRASGSR